MDKKLTVSAKDEKVPFAAAVRGSKTPVLKLSNECTLKRKCYNIFFNWTIHSGGKNAF